MGLFKTLYEIATIPAAIAKDIVTLGGIATDRDEPYTKEKMEEIEDAWED
jgi:hypothetical protein